MLIVEQGYMYGGTYVGEPVGRLLIVLVWRYGRW